MHHLIDRIARTATFVLLELERQIDPSHNKRMLYHGDVYIVNIISTFASVS